MSFLIFASHLNIEDRINLVVQKKPHSSRVRPRFKLNVLIEKCYQRCFQPCDPAHNSFKVRDTVHDAVDTILSRIYYCSVDLVDLMQNIETEPIHPSPEEPVEQAIPDPLPAVKIQFYRIFYAVYVVYPSGAIATVCHNIFPPLYDNLKNLF